MTLPIPIHFTHNNKQYTAELGQVMGAGSTAVFHLMINNYYAGRLRRNGDVDGWVFDATPKTEVLQKYVPAFVKAVEEAIKPR